MMQFAARQFTMHTPRIFTPSRDDQSLCAEAAASSGRVGNSSMGGISSSELPLWNTTIECTKDVNDDYKLNCGNFSLIRKHELTDLMWWVFLSSYIGLIAIAALMSGLILAILSLDLTVLEVMEKAGMSANGKPATKESKYAHRILPLARRHHIVLVSMVIANSLAVEAMPVVLDELVEPWYAISISVTAVLIFGEVLPQAICNRFGLAIGYYMAWLVWVVVGLTFIVSWPVSLLLDKLLGEKHGTFFRRAELIALVGTYGQASGSHSRAAVLSEDEVKIIRAALNMTSKKAESLIEARTEQIFMIPIEGYFDEVTLRNMMETGHSRFPIYANGDRSEVVGVVLAKNLILLDPAAKLPVRDAMAQNFNFAFSVPYLVDKDEPVHNLLDRFQKGETHMAFVTKKDEETGRCQIIGIATLEDLVEMLLEDEIWDETDRIRKTLGQKAMSKRWTGPLTSPCAPLADGGKGVCKGPPGHPCKMPQMKGVIVSK